jgi:hypothetical protein
MDSHEWKIVYQAIKKMDSKIKKHMRKCPYSDRLIVAMYLWSVAHDRPLCWACQRSSYGRCFRPRRLPSISQFSRRLRSDRVQQLLQAVHEHLAEVNRTSQVAYLDGRGFPVGNYSKDPDAHCGWAAGRLARGYRLHAWATPDGRIPLWCVTSLNVAEVRVAAVFAEMAPRVDLLLADNLYDSKKLYDDYYRNDICLLTSFSHPHAGKGHRQQSPVRLAAIEAWPDLGKYVFRDRLEIERIFGRQACSGGGLGPLPGFVRSLGRVRRWIGAKLIFYHARLLKRRTAA